MVLVRLKQYIDYKHISVAAFEKSIGMSNASFGKSLKNGGAIGSDKLENILVIYTDINPIWLLTGEGEMLRSADGVPATQQVEPTIIYRDNPDKDVIIKLQQEQIDMLKEQISFLKSDFSDFSASASSDDISPAAGTFVRIPTVLNPQRQKK